MKYTMISATSIDELVRQVNCHIQEGWRPQGGGFVTVNKFTNNNTFYQAIVKDGNPIKP